MLRIDISTCTPDGSQICKQQWLSAVTIMAFTDLPRETQQALFTSTLNDDTVKQVNILGLQGANAIIEAFQIQYVAAQVYLFMNKTFTTGPK